MSIQDKNISYNKHKWVSYFPPQSCGKSILKGSFQHHHAISMCKHVFVKSMGGVCIMHPWFLYRCRCDVYIYHWSLTANCHQKGIPNHSTPMRGHAKPNDPPRSKAALGIHPAGQSSSWPSMSWATWKMMRMITLHHASPPGFAYQHPTSSHVISDTAVEADILQLKTILSGVRFLSMLVLGRILRLGLQLWTALEWWCLFLTCSSV